MIPQNFLPRKEALDQFILPTIIVLVGICAFGLGRLSALEEGRGELVIHPPGDAQAIAQTMSESAAAASSDSISTADPATHNFVASKNGSKYYLPTCSGAKSINEANKIWFASAADAQAAGYTPAANCKF